MKSVKNHSRLQKILAIASLSFLLLFSTQAFSQGDPAKGKKLFGSLCMSCHKLEGKMVGPPLGGIEEKHTNEWLKAWIRDNGALRASGDKLANAIYKEYKGAAMTAFPQLSDQDIDDILAYTSNPDSGKVVTDGGEPVEVIVIQKDNTLSYILIAILIVLILAIFSLYQQVKGMRGEKAHTISGYLKMLWRGYVANGFLVFLTVIFGLLLAAFVGFSYLSQVGVDQGYQPIQPIQFSHAIHAGDNEIACEYCHSSARHSKHSGIPSVNVCMNCHRNIDEYKGTPFGDNNNEDLTAEIQKIYEAAGWDAENQVYTGVTKPIEWVQIHDLPDFAYFNHSQHVTVAGVKCQTCHGPVEEMHEVYQYSPLTMGWCIDCHRETEVDMTENGYYKKIHEQLAKKYGVKAVTEAQMGGLECGKCHY